MTRLIESLLDEMGPDEIRTLHAGSLSPEDEQCLCDVEASGEEVDLLLKEAGSRFRFQVGAPPENLLSHTSKPRSWGSVPQQKRARGTKGIAHSPALLAAVATIILAFTSLGYQMGQRRFSQEEPETNNGLQTRSVSHYVDLMPHYEAVYHAQVALALKLHEKALAEDEPRRTALQQEMITQLENAFRLLPDQIRAVTFLIQFHGELKHETKVVFYKREYARIKAISAGTGGESSGKGLEQ